MERIVSHLKNSSDRDKKFRFYVRKNGFKLMDIPELSLYDVLVVPVKETRKVSYKFFVSHQIVS